MNRFLKQTENTARTDPMSVIFNILNKIVQRSAIWPVSYELNMSALFDSRVPRYLIIKKKFIAHMRARSRGRDSSAAIFYGVLPSTITS